MASNNKEKSDGLIEKGRKKKGATYSDLTPYSLSTSARGKLVQIAYLVGDILEEVVRAARGEEGFVSGAEDEPKRAKARVPYRPTEPVSETDKKAAEQLLAARGLVEVQR